MYELFASFKASQAGLTLPKLITKEEYDALDVHVKEYYRKVEKRSI